MDPANIAEDTERIWFCPQTDRSKDGQTGGQADGQGETSITPINFVEAWYNDNTSIE